MCIETSNANGKVAFNLVRAAKTKTIKDGNANVAYKKLKAKYAPDTAPTLTKLHKQFYSFKLNKNADPDVFITTLEDLRVRMEEMESSMSDEQFMVYVLNNLTTDYDTLIDLLGRRIGSTNDPLTLEELREELNLRFERITSRRNDNGNSNEDGEEHALYAGAKHKGKCEYCGKRGHRAAACWEKDPSKRLNNNNRNNGNGNARNGNNNNNNNNTIHRNTNNNSNGNNGSIQNRTRFTGTCNYCNKVGHKEVDCFKKRRDNDQANSTTDSTNRSSTTSSNNNSSKGNNDTCELVFMAWEIPSASDTTEPEDGMCYECGTIGMIGNYCVNCENGNTYHRLDADVIADHERLYQLRTRTIPERIADAVREVDDNHTEMEEFLTVMMDVLNTKDDIDEEMFVEPRLEFLNTMGITTVKQLLIKIFDVVSWFDHADFEVLVTTQEKLYYLELGTEWLEAAVRATVLLDQAHMVLDIDSDKDTELQTTSTKPQNTSKHASVPWTTKQEHDFLQLLLPYIEPTSNQQHNSAPDTAAAATHTSTLTSSNHHTWLADSGASCHMTCSDAGMFDFTHIKTPIKLGDGRTLLATKIGKLKLQVTGPNNTRMDIILTNCKYVPNLWINLFSITTALSQGWNISNNGLIISLSKNHSKLTFNEIFRTDNGQVIGINLKRILSHDMSNVLLEHGRVVQYDVLHKTLGHINDKSLRLTAKYYGIKLNGTPNPCYECSISKAKQKNTSKWTDVKSKTPGERLFIDISSSKALSFSGSKFWLLIVDDASDKCWSQFLKFKSDLPQQVINLIKLMKSSYNKTVKYIRLDDAGENKSLQELCLTEGLGIQFEFTGPGVPQYNGRAERKFAVLYARVRTVLNGARLPKYIRDGVWAEAAHYSTDIENIIVTATKQVSADNKFYGNTNNNIGQLRIFGEIGVVHFGKKIRAKLDDRGKPCMFLGRAPNHSSDTHRFLNLATNKIITSRNVTWLNKVYGEWKGLTASNMTCVSQYDDDDDDEFEDNEEKETLDQGRAMNQENVGPQPVTTRLQREMRRLGGFFNPEATTFHDSHKITEVTNEDDSTQTSDITPDTGNILIDRRSIYPEFALLTMDYDKVPANQYKDLFVSPTSFDEAWDHQCSWQRTKWRAGVTKELGKMNQLQVWEVVKRTKIPPDRKCIKYKWIFEVKRDGTFKARLVACGYSQIPGVDFQESYSPVVNDVAFRIMVIFQMAHKLDSIILDVEAAFLNGDLDEEIYMECPKGMNSKQDEVLLLRKSLYGLVQAARQFFIKYTQILTKIGFVQSYAEPCLFIRTYEKGMVLMAVHVDDCYIIGTTTALNDTIDCIKKSGLNVTVQRNIKDYLSCKILFDEHMTKAWFGQPHLTKKLQKTFGTLVKGMPTYKTPGTPSFNIVRPKDGDAKLNQEEQSIYRSAVGSLLQFIKYSRPDIANSVRELAKCMDGATPAAFKEMKRIIKYVLDTQFYGLRIQPDFTKGNTWQMTVFTDSDWAGDKDNRHSVSGYAIFLLNVPILWKSRLQRTVALSSSEAEYYAISEAAKEIKFVYQILDSIGIKIHLPIVVNVDNVGAIFMTENVTATTRTRHVDARYHYVREFVSEGFLKNCICQVRR